MTREQRAKQFQPFDAMKGLQEALRDREERHARVERTEISEEKTDANSAVLARVEKGMKIKLFCYHAFHDVKMEGRVSKIDIVYKYLVLNETKIYFDDIYDIRICDYK